MLNENQQDVVYNCFERPTLLQGLPYLYPTHQDFVGIDTILT